MDMVDTLFSTDPPLGGTPFADPGSAGLSLGSGFDEFEAPTYLTDTNFTEEVAATSDLETIATEPAIAIDPPIWQTYSMVLTCVSLPPPEMAYFSIDEPTDNKTFPPTEEPGVVDVEGLEILGDPALAEGVSLNVAGGNPDYFGYSEVNLSPEHLEEPPIEILPSGEILPIDSGDFVRPIALVDPTPVTDPPVKLESIALEGNEPIVTIDPPIWPAFEIAAICYMYNPPSYEVKYKDTVTPSEIHLFPADGEPEVVEFDDLATIVDPTQEPSDYTDLTNYNYTVEDNGVSLTLLPACLDYPVPMGEPQVDGPIKAEREPRMGIWLRGEVHTMDSGDLVRPFSPIADPTFTAPPENLRTVTAALGTEMPNATEVFAVSPAIATATLPAIGNATPSAIATATTPATGTAAAISLQPPAAQPAVDPITGTPALVQPTDALQPSDEAGQNLTVDPVPSTSIATAVSASSRRSGFPFAKESPASPASPSQQKSSETVPTTSGFATTEASTPATTSALTWSLVGFGSSAGDPLVMGWGIESLLPPLIADLFPNLIAL